MKPSSAEQQTAYSYLRFSSAAQEDGDSLRRQAAMRDAWLARNPSILLDQSLKLLDRAVGAFTGEHRKNLKHALGAFVDLVTRGRVPSGSYLIVENLDRLTRENPVQSIPAVLSLIAAGIRVVQLSPCEVVYDSDMDQGKLLTMLWELARGHGESKRKSELIGQAWAAKKRAARDGVPHGKTVPAWITLEDGKYRLIPAAAATVRSLFQWCAAGMGLTQILRRLVEAGTPTLLTGRTWSRSYVAKIIASRAAMGEYQPGRGRHGKLPDGDPIPGYFPAAVTEAEWSAAQMSKRARVCRTGRPAAGGGPTSPFAGLLHDAKTGSPLRVRKSHSQTFLLPADCEERSAPMRGQTFPLPHLVDGLLSQLRELSAVELFNDPGAGQVQQIEGRLFDCERRLKAAVERFESDPESSTWADRVSAYDKEKRGLVRELNTVRQSAASPASASWSEAVKLMRENEPSRLRQCMLTAVADVRCLFVPRGAYRLAAVQVWFVGGECHRDYLIWSYTPQKWNVRKHRDRWQAISFPETLQGDFDLRERSNAAALAALLEKLDLSEFS